MPQFLTNPDSRYKPAVRLKGALAAATAVVNATPVSEYLQVSGSSGIRARIKTSGAGAIDVTFGFFANDVFTAYTTGNPAQVAVLAATEAKIEASTVGEAWAKITFTPSANGTITYCDVSQVRGASAGGGSAVTAALGAFVDGAIATLGAIADAAYTGSGTATVVAALKGIYAALTDATADSLVHQARDSARSTVTFVVDQQLGQSTEKLLTMAISVDGAASSSATHYEPAAGKRLRIQTMVAYLRTTTGNTTAAPCKVTLRQNTAGNAGVGSQEQESVAVGGTGTANFLTAIAALFFPESRQILGDGTTSFGLTALCPLWATTTADPFVHVVITGYLY